MTLAPRCLALALVAGPALADAPPAETIATPAGREITRIALPDAEYSDVTLFWPGPTALAVSGLEGLYSLAPQLAFVRAGGRGFEKWPRAWRTSAPPSASSTCSAAQCSSCR